RSGKLRVARLLLSVGPGSRRWAEPSYERRRHARPAASRPPLKGLSTASRTGCYARPQPSGRRMEFLLLGPLEVVRDGRSVSIGGGKQRALLGVLLLHPNEVVSRDRLIDELWSDRAPGTAAHSLDIQVSRLRKVLDPEELLETRAGGYVLRVEPEQIDARRFERLLEEGRRANAEDKPAAARDALESALGLWRGGALADLAYTSFA